MPTSLHPQALSTAVREQTAQAHEAAEHATFMHRLLEGSVPHEAVVDYTAQLWWVYQALEEAVYAARGTSIAQTIHDPRLERTERLVSDLTALCGPTWRTKVEILPATENYAQHLRVLAASPRQHAPRIAAHHYVRYLGDISGGQVIARRLQERYGLPAEALSFYDFADIGKIPPYRSAYRSHLDALELSPQQRADFLEEACSAFAANTAVFNELGGLYPAAA